MKKAFLVNGKYIIADAIVKITPPHYYKLGEEWHVHLVTGETIPICIDANYRNVEVNRKVILEICDYFGISDPEFKKWKL